MHLLDITKKIFLGTTRKARIVSSIGLFLAVCAFGAVAVAPGAAEEEDLPTRIVTQELALPDISNQIAEFETQLGQEYVREERVLSGDTLWALLARMGVSDPAAMTFIRSDRTASQLLRLKAGRVVQAKVSGVGELLWLSMEVSEGRAGEAKDIVVTRNENGFIAADASTALEKRIEMRTGVIQSSLFGATDAARVPDPVTSRFVDIFATQIDFRSDLRRGDSFSVVYETFWQNGTYIRSGRILAAEYVNAGRPHQAVWYESQDGKLGGYYDFNGKPQKKAFLKSPVAFTRISSGFGVRRHPVYGYSRAHKGIDFAAPSGTPIKAAADGSVAFSGWKGGYGKMIVLKHWGSYSTAYGHMSRIVSSMRRGAKVRQGDIIGYVGSTGVSTGPHLHYEFRVGKAQVNPRAIVMPEAPPLRSAELEKFRKAAEEMEHRFAVLNPDFKPVKVAKK
ncbi:MAG: M23 family metallopeptidase [Oxalobacter sp.]|nr:MAG: M23 family metallopeptidase [Oxalobacter sp.]